MATTPLSVGPANQTEVPATVHNLPSTVPPNGSVNSNLVQVQGYSKVAVGLTMSQAGTVSIQRYLDQNGTVALGSPTNQALVAGQAATLTVNDGQLFGSFEIILLNGAGTTALVANLAVVVASDPNSLPGVAAGSYQTATSTTVTVPVANAVPVLAANANAKVRVLRAPRSNSSIIWLSFGGNAVSGQGPIDLSPGDIYEMSVADGNLYQGVISAISDAAALQPQTILATEGV